MNNLVRWVVGWRSGPAHGGVGNSEGPHAAGFAPNQNPETSL
ncbi:MAG: hypothetical protein AAGA46_14230 [Cyanobacteria bacterium P01_F01_bin.13]